MPWARRKAITRSASWICCAASSSSAGQLALDLRVVRGQAAQPGLVLGRPGAAAVVGLEIILVAGQHKSPAAGLDTLHGELQVLEGLQDVMGMAHPAGAGAGHGQAAIRCGADDEQGQNGGPEPELYLPIRA